MTLLLGMGAPGTFRVFDLYHLGEFGGLRGSFRCGRCGVHYCYDCSDRDTRCCRCRASDWLERQYFADPETPAGKLAQARLVEAQLSREGFPFDLDSLPPEISPLDLTRYLAARDGASLGIGGWMLLAVAIGLASGWGAWGVLSPRVPSWIAAVCTGLGFLVVAYAQLCVVAMYIIPARGILFACPQCRKFIQVKRDDVRSAWECQTRGCGFPHYQYWRSKQ